MKDNEQKDKPTVTQDILRLALKGKEPHAKWFPGGMDDRKIELFLKQFPFVRTHISDSDINRVYVTGLTLDVVNRSLWAKHVPDDEGFDLRYPEVAFLLDKEGSIVERKEHYEAKCFQRGWLGFPLLWKPRVLKPRVRFHKGLVEDRWCMACEDNTIARKIKELGEKASEVTQVLSYHYYTCAVIIYLLPKGTNLLTWHEAEMAKVEEKNRAEVSAFEIELRREITAAAGYEGPVGVSPN